VTFDYFGHTIFVSPKIAFALWTLEDWRTLLRLLNAGYVAAWSVHTVSY